VVVRQRTYFERRTRHVGSYGSPRPRSSGCPAAQAATPSGTPFHKSPGRNMPRSVCGTSRKC
jgi:hypothetical protein